METRRITIGILEHQEMLKYSKITGNEDMIVRLNESGEMDTIVKNTLRLVGQIKNYETPSKFNEDIMLIPINGIYDGEQFQRANFVLKQSASGNYNTVLKNRWGSEGTIVSGVPKPTTSWEEIQDQYAKYAFDYCNSYPTQDHDPLNLLDWLKVNYESPNKK